MSCSLLFPNKVEKPSRFSFGGFYFFTFHESRYFTFLLLTFLLFTIFFSFSFKTCFSVFWGRDTLPFLLVYNFTVSLCLVSVTLYLFTFTTKIENHQVSRVFALVSTKTCIWCC